MDTETDTPDELMRATRRALCEHGYADLTTQRIADQSSLSTASIHYHFDTREELLNAFLDTLLDRFEERLACEARDPRERLNVFVTAIFEPAQEDTEDFPIALMELKAQAPYHTAYRERLLEMDRRMREVVASAVREGIENGYFAEADPEVVARFVVTAINGAHTRMVALGEGPAETRLLVENYLEQQLGWPPEGAT